MTTIDLSDSFTLIDIMNKYNANKLLNTGEAVIDLLKCIRVCITIPRVFICKQYDSIIRHPTITYSSEATAKKTLKSIKMGVSRIGNKLNEKSAWDIIQDNIKDFTVRSITFFSTNPSDFSFFQGYKYDVLTSYNEELISPWINHVRDVIANRNIEVFEYVMNWIAMIIKKPDYKTGIAIVILGEQGTGKNAFFTDIIAELLSGYSNKNITQMESILGQFNASIENKKLIVLNELQSIDITKSLNSDALKSLITDDVVEINQKNENRRVSQNVANFIMVSNNGFPIKIEQHDRRYVVTRTSNKHRGDWEYFNKLSSTFTTEFYDNLLTYFKHRDTKDFNVREIPNTEAKDAIKELCIGSIEQFIRDEGNKIVDVNGLDLFSLYSNYADKNRFRQYNRNEFIARIKQYTGEAKVKRVKGKIHTLYTLLPEYRPVDKSCIDIVEQFVEDKGDKMVDITGPDLFNMFNDYVGENKFNQYTKNKFITRIKQYTGEAKNKKVNGKQQMVYNLLPEYLKENEIDMPMTDL